MNIDMAALHAIEADKGITVDVVIDTIKTALLTAYRHTEGHEADAHIDIDKKTGVVKVMAHETDEDDGLPREIVRRRQRRGGRHQAQQAPGNGQRRDRQTHRH